MSCCSDGLFLGDFNNPSFRLRAKSLLGCQQMKGAQGG